MPSAVGKLLDDLDQALRAFGVRYYLFGAQAALLHGAARLTADVDITVDLGDRETSALVAALSAAGFAFRVSDEDFIARTRVLPAYHPPTHIPVDIVLAGPGIEELFLERAEVRDVEGVRIPVASAEDVIIMKVLAGRPKDLEDVEAIVAAHPGTLDAALIRETLGLLERALDRSDLLVVFEGVFAKS
jgi:hypothetical protein